MGFNLLVISFTILFGLYFSDSNLIKWSEETKRKRYIIIISLILILQSGLRHVAVGPDTYAYYLDFIGVKGTNWQILINNFINHYKFGYGKDPGYDILQKLFQYFSGNYQIYLLSIATLFFYALGNFIYQNTESIRQTAFAFVLYSALFYSFFSITGHRQTIATAMTLIGFELIKKRRFLLFLIMILLTSTIHRSVLIFIPFYFIYNFRRPDVLLPFVLATFPVLMYRRIDISEIVIKIAGYDQYGLYEGAGTYTFTAMLTIMAIITWWRVKFVISKKENSIPFFNAYIIAIALTPLTWVNPSAMRIVQYFSIFMLVLFPFIADSFTSSVFNLRRIVYILSIFVLVVLFIRSGAGGEYRFFWQEMELGPNYPYRWAIID